jgi:subtilase family serine protease
VLPPRWRDRAVAVLLVLLVLLVVSVPLAAGDHAGATTTVNGPPAPRHRDRDVCGPVAPGHARCFAKVVTGAGGAVPYSAVPRGYGPDELRRAYRLPASPPGERGTGAVTVAIVDAYDDPKADSDLAAYRAYYGLPPCRALDGCFRKVNQRGGSSLPAPDDAWAAEIALDLDMVSAACPACRLLLVEADSSSLADLAKAEDTAAALGAVAISNSYGDREARSQLALDRSYDHPGVAITVATGDSGYGVNFPAASGHVTAVGGTSLERADNDRGWVETAWPDGSSGCSAVFPKPTWQHDGGCPGRTVADVAAVADPDNGVAVYHSGGLGGGPWLTMGGTSAAAPLVAAAYALAGHAGARAGGGVAAAVPLASLPYLAAARDGGSLFDVTSGSNGACRPSYLCVAGPGYDGPTGLGTPNGPAAF